MESSQPDTAATTIPSQEAVTVDGAEGPETIDSTNPALYTVLNASADKIDTTIKNTGMNTNNGRRGKFDNIARGGCFSN